MRKSVLSLFIIAIITVSCSSPFAVKIFPTPTPAATATSTFTPAPTSTPTQIPTPTPPPAVRVEIAEQAIFVGNYEQARREFQNAQMTSGDAEIQAAAALGMGRSLYLAQNYSTAIDALEAMVTNYPESQQVANAYYFLARSYEAQDQYEKAIEAYGRFLELRPGVIDAYIQELRGNAYVSAENPAGAAEAYQAALQADQEGSTTWLKLKLGKAYSAAGDYSGAIKTYLEVYESSDNEYARAQANLLMGQAYLTMGMPEQAHARFLDSVASFPRAYDSYTGLVQLVNDGVQVNELSRGIVDYYAGQYGLAVEALNRHIETAGEVDARAYHFRALSRLASNEAELAIQDWDYIINNYQGDDLWATAWDEKAYAQWAYLDQYDQAAQTLLQYIELAPESAPAPDFLYEAGRIYERNGQLAEAAATWEQLIEKYPAAEKSHRGLFLAGVTYYRLGDYAKALTVFQRAMVLATNPEEQAASYLWIGKAQQANGDAAAARAAWQQAAQLDPTGYYSERANDLLQDRPPFVVTQPVDLGYDLSKERADAENWLRAEFELAPEIDLNGLGELGSDARARRGLVFWELGLYNEARDEFESLRQSLVSDPISSYRLMNQALEMGLYRTAILASRQVLDLANMDDVSTLKAPAYFNHVRFGVYFKDQVVAASQKDSIHPLFLLSVLRQESMFEGFAISSAGARGLMQIMPATGHEIASGLGWPEGYDEDDLYRPEVSITLGARYLARQREYFGGSAYAALAAYNGGPGNTMMWNEMAQNDPDLLLEVIRADETRTYIRQIYEFFNIYRILYERGL